MSKNSKKLIIIGILIVIISTIVWWINFLGIYGDVSQSGFGTNPNQTQSSQQKFDKQSNYRRDAIITSIIGYAIIATGLYDHSKKKL